MNDIETGFTEKKNVTIGDKRRYIADNFHYLSRKDAIAFANVLVDNDMEDLFDTTSGGLLLNLDKVEDECIINNLFSIVRGAPPPFHSKRI